MSQLFEWIADRRLLIAVWAGLLLVIAAVRVRTTDGQSLGVWVLLRSVDLAGRAARWMAVFHRALESFAAVWVKAQKRDAARKEAERGKAEEGVGDVAVG